jgi:aminomethyltransferase
VLKAKFVDFAGYSMPVLYEGPHGGVKNEHLQCRNSCSIFDVSHMGQFHFVGKDAGKFLEYTTVADTQSLRNGQAALTLVMNSKGGIKDDCVLTKVNDSHFYVVFNGGNKSKIKAHMQKVMLENRR